MKSPPNCAEKELRADDVRIELLVVSASDENQFPSLSHDVVDLAMRLEVDASFDPYGECDEGVAVQVFRVLSDGDDLTPNPGVVSGAQCVGPLELYRVSHGESLPTLHHLHLRVIERASDDRVVSEDTLVHIEPPHVLGFGTCDPADIARLLPYCKYSILMARSQVQTKNQHFCCFYALNSTDFMIQKFSFPKMQNRQLIFLPKIQYKLAAERSETTANSLRFSKMWT